MTDPELTATVVAIAGAIAGKTAESAIQGGRKALGSLIGYVRERLGRDEPKALAAADPDTADPDALALTLLRLSRNEPEFADELRRQWSEAEAETVVNTGTVSMDVSGSDNTVNQIGNAGTVNFGTQS